MSWFERYGIVGIYYVLISIGWSTAFELDNFDTKLLPILAGMAVPIGYFLSILSQNIYYVFPVHQVHRTLIEKLKDEAFFVKYENIKNDEKKLEVVLGIMKVSKSEEYIDYELKYREFLKESVQKRWDVFSISSSMMIATFISWLPALVLHIWNSNGWPCIWNSIISWNYFSPRSIILIMILSIIFFVFYLSRKLMFEQIVEIYSEFYKDVREKEKRSINLSYI